MAKISFTNNNRSFQTDLKKAVEQYFIDRNIKSTGNFSLYFKTIVLLSLTLGVLTYLLIANPSYWIFVPLCILMGVLLSGIGFNIMHDANHGSYSTKKWLNELLGLTMNALGSNAFLWKQKHNIVHHTYTNIAGVDEDIEMPRILRISTSQPRKKVHRYQHIYMFFLYGLASLSWVWINDFKKYFTHRILVTEMKDFDTKEHIIFWASKLFYVAAYVVLPIFVFGFWKFLLGYILLNVSLSITLTVVFQLAHVVEHNHFEELEEGQDRLQIENDWAIHQVITTADFATRSKIVSWFLGGLNFQVEHHLFPRISHVHYPKIQAIVKEVCQRYGIEYREHKTLLQAVRSHVNMMRYLGRA